jgi:hypothetical protein
MQRSSSVGSKRLILASVVSWYVCCTVYSRSLMQNVRACVRVRADTIRRRNSARRLLRFEWRRHACRTRTTSFALLFVGVFRLACVSDRCVMQWFHYVLSVDDQCNHRLFIDGQVVKPLGGQSVFDLSQHLVAARSLTAVRQQRLHGRIGLHGARVRRPRRHDAVRRLRVSADCTSRFEAMRDERRVRGCCAGRRRVRRRAAAPRRCAAGPIRVCLARRLLPLPRLTSVFAAFKLRIGAGFYGSINNLVVSSGALVYFPNPCFFFFFFFFFCNRFEIRVFFFILFAADCCDGNEFG